MFHRMSWFLALLLAAGPLAGARAQDSEDLDEPAAEESSKMNSGTVMADSVDEAEAPAAKPKWKPSKKNNKKKLPRVKVKVDAVRGLLSDIARGHRNQIAFGSAEYELWKAFWTKMRDERGLFQVRLSKQREGFLDSLRSLDAKDHGQSLGDFEVMQGNVMKSFEEEQGLKIRNFIAERVAKLQEFGAIQEEERMRLGQISDQAWAEDKAKMNIESAPPPPLPDQSIFRK